MNTLGQSIGIIRDSFSITNNRGNTTSITIQWDFSTSTDNDIKSWLAGNRRIAFQRPSRALSIDEINELDGSTVMASNAGKKTMSRSERIENMMAMNPSMTVKMAEYALDNPTKWAEMMELVMAQTSTE